MGFEEALKAVLAEVADVAGRVSAEESAAFAAAVNDASRVFVTGQGRSGLIARAFAMRLSQLGLAAYVVPETTTPPIAAGDLLVAVSGSGETPVTCHFAKAARAAGAAVACVVADPGSALARLSDTTLVIPGRAKTGSGRESAQMPGSLFEQAALVVLDSLVMVLADMRGSSHDSMRDRHANLE